VWQAWKRSLQALRALGLVTYVKSRCSGAGIARLMGRFHNIDAGGVWCLNARMLDRSNCAVAGTVVGILIGSTSSKREGDPFFLATVFLLQNEDREWASLSSLPHSCALSSIIQRSAFAISSSQVYYPYLCFLMRSLRRENSAKADTWRCSFFSSDVVP